MDGKQQKFDLLALSLEASTGKLLQAEIDLILSYSDSIFRLEKDLLQFGERLKIAYSKNEFLDLATAIKLHLKSAIILNLCRENPQGYFVPYLAAGVAYLIREEDAQSDFSSMDGFDDDQKVLDTLISYFGLTEIVESRYKELRATKELKIA